MNTVQQQFADEWKKVSAVVESEARRQLLTFGHLDYSMLNSVLRDERDIWFKAHSARYQWLKGLEKSDEMDMVKVSTRIRQAHLRDIYHVGKSRVSTLSLKVFYFVISLLMGCLVWFGTDLYFSPNIQEYLSSPLKWIAFPLLVTVLTYTFCLPKVAQSKEEKIQELIRAVTEEVGALGSELLLLMQPPKG
ncbi:hypothetical protein [uncultured Prevotella sp.]|uniref:hypothetical protein n=1 Tax=uncultured Prevotella sp. TaxID=159272 RepID=UPI002671D19F|nr:hypothetical protein [uncultured Prevotella sp.]